MTALALVLLILAQVAPPTPAAQAAAPRPPNVILILADDLGPGDLGCYGQKIIRTPNLDALASRATRFTDFYAGSPVCAPSRCVLLTGLNSGHAAIRDNKELQPEGQQPLPADAVTIAQILKPRAYATAAIGKWGLGPPGSTGDPLAHGFDHFFGYNCQRHAHNHFPAWLYRDRDKIELPANPARPARGDEPGASYAPDLCRDEALAFIRANRDRPFFLYFATTVPHLALQVPRDSLDEYKGVLDDKAYDGKKGYLAHATPHAAYAAMVTRMDRDVGALLALLRELDLERDTLVIFTSDNGPTFDVGGADTPFFDSAQGRRGFKSQLYDGGIRAPLIVSMPGRVREGHVATGPCAAWDLLPTIAEFAGAQAPAGLDGVSLAPACAGAPVTPHPLYWEFPAGGGWQAARLANWKCVRRNARARPDGPIEVYDLSTDPAESRDVALDHADVAEAARAVFAARTRSALAEWNY